MPASFETSRDAVLAALAECAAADSAVSALWLQGSLATDEADAFSDIDAYLAVDDAQFESRWADRANLLTRLGGALAWADAHTPGLTAVHALMVGGARLDLFFEKTSAIASLARPAVRVLVDKADIASALALGWRPSTPAVARSITTIIRMTRQGATWPLRVLGRGQWPTLARIELNLINQQIAQLMAVRHDAANFYKNDNSLSLALSPEEQNELASLTADALAALQAQDSAALKTVHLRVLDALVREGRATCAALGVDYPIDEASEGAVRRLIEDAWPD